MGTPPARRRGPARSLGAIGHSVLADTAVGGGHDALIRRALGQGGQEWKSKPSLKLDDLGDVEVDYNDPAVAPANGDVLTFDATIESPDGGMWVPAPVSTSPQDLGTWTGSGSFTTSPYNFQQNITVNANSKQLVTVTARAYNCDTFVDTDGNDYDLPWTLVVYDATHDPGATTPVGATGIGKPGTSTSASGYAQAVLWAMNPTGSNRSQNIYCDVYASDPNLAGLGGDVSIRIDTLYTA